MTMVSSARVHTLAVVVPVFRGADTLDALLAEIEPFFEESATADGHKFRVDEVMLVHDHGPDQSAAVIRALALRFAQVTPVWLARNYGQHAATLAGIGSSSAEWVVTLDEDGQHAPADIAILLDCAIGQAIPLVYGRHAAGAPHSRWRNISSRLAKRVGRAVAGREIGTYTSFRLVLGAHARSVAAYCGPRTYLDVALRWASGSFQDVVVQTRDEWRSGSGYDLAKLLSHFWSLVLSSGTRPLRIISSIGALVSAGGFVFAAVVLVRAWPSDYNVPGWASVMVSLLGIGGLMLLAIGVVAEYLGALLRS
ncbi:MAG: glycosyltransferase, partial [Ilumatobacteraceae bacterium]|nr:glycosyltransferase [Ilumatobacteraceae bacterium]